MLGYDPAHVQQLDGAVRRAADHLVRLPAGDDPLAGTAVSVARLVRTHLEQDWLALLVRVASSAAMGAFDAAGPVPITRAHSTGVIASVVEAMTPEERTYFQGFVDAAAVAVAQELSRYDDHGEYAIDHLPAELTTLDNANDWNWLAQLYLVEQYHDMVERSDVELQRDGDVYWIDPFHFINVKSEVMSEVILAAVTLGGGMRPGGGITRATAATATAMMPPPRILATKPSFLVEVSPGVYRSPAGLTYGPGSVEGHRITHLMEHARPNSTKKVHSVFLTTEQNLTGVTDEVLGLVDEAWGRRGVPVAGDPGKYVVPMGRDVGTRGEQSMTIIVEPGTTIIISGYPS